MCQLKKDIAEERLTCSSNTECTLAAYALQAEMGDFDSEEYHEDGYIQQCAWFCDVVSFNFWLLTCFVLLYISTLYYVSVIPLFGQIQKVRKFKQEH